jgi:hypothetical protein
LRLARPERVEVIRLSLLFLLAANVGVAVELVDAELLKVRRIFVEQLSGGESAAPMRDLLISALQASKLFLLTETPERADTTLKGTGGDAVFEDMYQSSEGLNANVSAPHFSSQSGRSGAGYNSTNSSLPGVSVGENDSSRIAERKHEAMAAVRLVNKEGDIVWSTTKESSGGKFRGASTDVAEKIVRQLVEDLQTARKPKILKP